MKRLLLLAMIASLAGMMLLAQNPNSNGNGNAYGYGNGNGAILIPDSSIETPGDVGRASHTNHIINLKGAANAAKPAGLSPQQAWNAYALGNAPTLGSGTIVIVDAYDYPTAAQDLAAFSTQFGLPQANFQTVYATGKKPSGNCGWAQEAALDIEWAHAMAPNAKIVLVEAASNSFADLFKAIDVASTYAPANGGYGQVSMSWGGSEFSSEATYDSHFKANGVVYFAASGDTGGATIYPSVSPFVVAAGGTTLNVEANGKWLSETGWSGSGGGPSKYEPKPSYQSGISLPGNMRGVPDFSFDADPYTGVAVYDTTKCQGMSGWMVFGGTSVASPALAGLVNAVGSKAASSAAELTLIYNNLLNANSYSINLHDIQSGTAGKYNALVGWDFVTGVGSNKGVLGK